MAKATHQQAREGNQLDLFADGFGEASGSRLRSDELTDPYLHGAAHQTMLESEGSRKAGGAFYTPAHVVEGLLDLSLDPVLAQASKQGPAAVAAIRILDPACGSGNFLIAAAGRVARTLASLGWSMDRATACAFGEVVVGVDIDDRAAEICRRSLCDASGGTVTEETARRQVRTSDSLTLPFAHESLLSWSTTSLPSWGTLMAETSAVAGFDLIIGNPPFLSQLSTATAASRSYASALRNRFGQAATSYTDPAALFLILSRELVSATGRVCLIEPLSLLSARDAGPARAAVIKGCSVDFIWIANEKVFDAVVDVCAIGLAAGAEPRPTRLFDGATFSEAGTTRPPGPDDHTWAHLLAAQRGVPSRVLVSDGVIGDVATATADFRDQYYGLADHIVDREDAGDGSELLPPLVTSGLIDPALLLWGIREAKFNRVKYQHPRVTISELSPKLQEWAHRRLIPKVLVALQTRVLEVVADPDGKLLPSVPVITVLPRGTSVWHLGALLSSPPCVLTAAHRHLGAAMGSDALKLSARDVLALPRPAGNQRWDQGAVEFRRASEAATAETRLEALTSCANEMCHAFGLGDDEQLVGWWLARLPGGRNGS